MIDCRPTQTLPSDSLDSLLPEPTQNIGFFSFYADTSYQRGNPKTVRWTMIVSGTEVFHCGTATEYGPSMANLRRVSEQLTLWLVMRGIAPERNFAVVDPGYYGFDFGFRIDNRYLDEFAEVELEFWHFALQLLPLRQGMLDWISKRRFKRLSTVRTGPDSFLLLIRPDPDSSSYEFPPAEYWKERDETFWFRHEVPVAMREHWHFKRMDRLLASGTTASNNATTEGARNGGGNNARSRI